jgi:hypothetical protein
LTPQTTRAETPRMNVSALERRTCGTVTRRVRVMQRAQEPW